jgi:hypothetical protein
MQSVVNERDGTGISTGTGQILVETPSSSSIRMTSA